MIFYAINIFNYFIIEINNQTWSYYSFEKNISKSHWFKIKRMKMTTSLKINSLCGF